MRVFLIVLPLSPPNQCPCLIGDVPQKLYQLLYLTRNNHTKHSIFVSGGVRLSLFGIFTTNSWAQIAGNYTDGANLKSKWFIRKIYNLQPKPNRIQSSELLFYHWHPLLRGIKFRYIQLDVLYVQEEGWWVLNFLPSAALAPMLIWLFSGASVSMATKPILEIIY